MQHQNPEHYENVEYVVGVPVDKNEQHVPEVHLIIQVAGFGQCSLILYKRTEVDDLIASLMQGREIAFPKPAAKMN